MTMRTHDYVIIGGGMTGAAAADGIRELDRTGTIGLLSAEPDPPYNRPPLSKGLWKGDAESSIWKPTPTGTTMYLGRRATKIDAGKHLVVDENGDEYTYDKLLLATGGSPRQLPFSTDNFIYYRTFADYRRLKELTQSKNRFAVLGGGFIGSEIAAALAIQDRRVTIIFPEENIGARVFPPDLAHFVTGYYREKGVDVRPHTTAKGAELQDGVTTLLTDTGDTIAADAVVAGLGILPETSLASDAGARVENGIVVDEHLRTSLADVWAAGDVASFANRTLGRLRVEHEDNALTMGRAAGRAMAGDTSPYDHIPSFYSDLFDLGYEAVGVLDSRLRSISHWKEPFREGVVWYLDDDRVAGVLLWNVWGKVDDARAIISARKRVDGEELKGALD